MNALESSIGRLRARIVLTEQFVEWFKKKYGESEYIKFKATYTIACESKYRITLLKPKAEMPTIVNLGIEKNRQVVVEYAEEFIRSLGSRIKFEQFLAKPENRDNEFNVVMHQWINLSRELAKR